MVITVTVVAVLLLIIVVMASGTGVTNVYSRYVRRGGYYPSGHPGGHSDRWGPYYQHGGHSHAHGLLY